MTETKSYSVRQKYFRNGIEVLVYKARVEIPCDLCSDIIKPDDLFSRSADKAGKVYGIRYSNCRLCMPFESELLDPELKLNRVQRDKELEKQYQTSNNLELLEGYQLTQVSLDGFGNSAFYDQMGRPLLRHEVTWLIRVANFYLEQNTAEQIDDSYIEWEDSLDSRNYSPSNLPKKTKGYVYLFQGTGEFQQYYKIGRTTDLSNRSKQLGTKLPFEIKLIHTIFSFDSIEAEKYWHNEFKSKRSNGEWFVLDKDDIEKFVSVEEM